MQSPDLLSPPSSTTPLHAKWIWQNGTDLHAYNQAIIAKRNFDLKPFDKATLRIAADSYYRLHINGQWINDGPCRSWPDHFQYDVIDVTPFLVEGANEIRVIAIHYGVGDFHRVPKQAGLIAQLDVQHADATTTTLITDDSWHIAPLTALASDTPKISIQMSPAELYDARQMDEPIFRSAAILCDAHAGPWNDLNPRDVALLSKQPRRFQSFVHAKVVQANGWNFCVPAARLVNPGLIEANHSASAAFGMATLVEANEAVDLDVQVEGMKFSINGTPIIPNTGSEIIKLPAGTHLVLAFASDMFGHDKDKALRFMNPQGFTLRNPVDPTHENPWTFIRFPEYAVATDDLVWSPYRDRDLPPGKLSQQYNRRSNRWLTTVKDVTTFQKSLVSKCELMPSSRMFVQDSCWPFRQRRVIGDTAFLVSETEASLDNSASFTTIKPTPHGDIELLYDLGEQNCGYWTFDLVADAGVEVDIFAVEYIAPDGRIQFSDKNRNGFRYITKQGENHYTSFKRRSGRYVFLTLRNQQSPVRLRHFGLIESTYPVNTIGSFHCSDERLDRIWDISTHTLKLCMEDTFTDCPLYEQTHWVGDARNEALIAFGVFGAHDLARRCIRISAQSLEHYPIVGSQTPSCWDVLLPAWSFLWGISTWDYYWETDDKDWLRGIYPDVIRNLKGAETFLDERDLFTGPFWNFFDWVRIDQDQKTVLHNSLFFVGAIDTALKQAEVLNDHTHVDWLLTLRSRLASGINRLWDKTKQAYPDSIRDNGKTSPSISQHTSFLSLLYDVVPQEHTAAALKNLTSPPRKMVTVGSPFAALYLYEAFEKFGLEDEIIKETYKHYLPMVESGATTVWESFPCGTIGGDGWPTRSHCHAWSSAPTRFLNRIILGIKDTSPGAATVQISPRPNGLTWANGTTATVRGPVHVEWKIENQTLHLTYTAPTNTKATFVKNDTHQGLTIIVNGKIME